MANSSLFTTASDFLLWDNLVQFGKWSGWKLIALRFLAFVIDFYCVFFIEAILRVIAFLITGVKPSSIFIFPWYRELLVASYYILGWFSPFRATIGMYVAGIELVNHNQQMISLKQAIIAYFITSIFLLWYNRIGVITSFIGDYPDAIMGIPLITLAVIGKIIVFIIIYLQVIFSAGKQNLPESMLNITVRYRNNSSSA